MTAVSKCDVQPLHSRLDIQEIQDLVHTDRDVHAGRSAALFDDLFNRIGIFLRILLFILFFKPSRVCPAVTDTPFVHRCSLYLFFFHLKTSFILYSASMRLALFLFILTQKGAACKAEHFLP